MSIFGTLVTNTIDNSREGLQFNLISLNIARFYSEFSQLPIHPIQIVVLAPPIFLYNIVILENNAYNFMLNIANDTLKMFMILHTFLPEPHVISPL